MSWFTKQLWAVPLCSFFDLFSSSNMVLIQAGSVLLFYFFFNLFNIIFFNTMFFSTIALRRNTFLYNRTQEKHLLPLCEIRRILYWRVIARCLNNPTSPRKTKKLFSKTDWIIGGISSIKFWQSISYGNGPPWTTESRITVRLLYTANKLICLIMMPLLHAISWQICCFV